jgi:uncharacterized RDD family membrane protein YckC
MGDETKAEKTISKTEVRKPEPSSSSDAKADKPATLFHPPDQETLDHVTDFAFKLDQSLIGKSLAKPHRRAAAQLVDLSLIAILGSAPVYISIVFLVYLFFLYRSSKAQQQASAKRFKHLRLLASFVLILFIVSTVGVFINYIFQEDSIAVLDTTIVNDEGVALSVRDNVRLQTYLPRLKNNIERADCVTDTCVQRLLEDLPGFLVEIQVQPEDLNYVLEQIFPTIDLPETQKQGLRVQLNDEYLQRHAAAEEERENEEEVEAEEGNTVLAWLLKQLEEFGLSFGWAAFYFSAMTAWFNGRTLGKYLFSIRVVKLDGKPLTLWESFGRYGGYGAGLATGLLGFLQVFWDPNRQGIQDKISGTVVIYE